MSPEQRTAALKIIERVFFFNDSKEVAENILNLDYYWGPEASVHILGMWRELKKARRLLRHLVAQDYEVECRNLYTAPPQPPLLEALRFIADHDLRDVDLSICGHIAHALVGKARDAIKAIEGEKE